MGFVFYLSSIPNMLSNMYFKRVLKRQSCGRKGLRAKQQVAKGGEKLRGYSEKEIMYRAGSLWRR